MRIVSRGTEGIEKATRPQPSIFIPTNSHNCPQNPQKTAQNPKFCIFKPSKL